MSLHGTFFIMVNIEKIKKIILSIIVPEYGDAVISEFSFLPKFMFDEEKNEWVDDTGSIIMTIEFKNEEEYKRENRVSLTRLIEGVIGFEVIVKRTLIKNPN